MKISHDLMRFLKNRAKSQGITQVMIANQFNISLPTVKRWYQGKGLSLEQASQLSEFLGISLGEALVSIKNTTQTFQYTANQEKYFAKHPEYLAFFDNLLRGHSVKKISTRFSLNELKVSKYLLQLENLGLLELHIGNKVKLLVSGEPVWRKNGDLVKKFKNKILTDFSNSPAQIKLDKFHLYDLLNYDLDKLILKLNDALQFATIASNRASVSSDKSKALGLRVSLKGFNWSLDNYLQ